MKSYELRDKMESWIIFVLIIGFILCCFYYFFCSSVQMPLVKKVVVQVEQIDSLESDALYSREQVDSLIAMVRSYEIKLDEKYQYLLEKREDDDRFKTWGALLIGLLVSVLGFFGYKSFKDLKNHCEEIARAAANTIASSTAKHKAETTAGQKVSEYLQNNLGEKINEAMTSYYNGESINVMEQRILDELRPIIDEEIDAKIREIQENHNNNTQGEHLEGACDVELNQDPLF